MQTPGPAAAAGVSDPRLLLTILQSPPVHRVLARNSFIGQRIAFRQSQATLIQFRKVRFSLSVEKLGPGASCSELDERGTDSRQATAGTPKGGEVYLHAQCTAPARTANPASSWNLSGLVA